MLRLGRRLVIAIRTASLSAVPARSTSSSSRQPRGHNSHAFGRKTALPPQEVDPWEALTPFPPSFPPPSAAEEAPERGGILPCLIAGRRSRRLRGR